MSRESGWVFNEQNVDAAEPLTARRVPPRHLRAGPPCRVSVYLRNAAGTRKRKDSPKLPSRRWRGRCFPSIVGSTCAAHADTVLGRHHRGMRWNEPGDPRVRLVLADPQHLVRHALRCFLDSLARYTVVAETARSVKL